MHPRELSIADFTYELPEDRIASYPLEDRCASRLLCYRRGGITEHTYAQLPGLLPPGSLLVFNNSRVIEARLLFRKPTGGIIEVFALEPHERYTDVTTAMNQTGGIDYLCLIGGASKWKHGMVLTHEAGDMRISARIADRRPGSFVVRFDWEPGEASFAQVLHRLGEMPIPPYLHREAEASDRERYQTVYAKSDGSVAAPTAGLHFTPALLEALREAGFGESFVTLHVGAGTFMPVKSERMDGHAMHTEFLEVPAELLDELAVAETVVPVGTTSMRTLESLYWMGVKTALQPDTGLSELEIGQWEVYDRLLSEALPKKEALGALRQWMDRRGLRQLVVRTGILIAPGYRFGVCNGLITNFHQPQSTLLLLVAALLGNEWKEVYRYALDSGFRFLSYGDGSLLLPDMPMAWQDAG